MEESHVPTVLAARGEGKKKKKLWLAWPELRACAGWGEAGVGVTFQGLICPFSISCASTVSGGGRGGVYGVEHDFSTSTAHLSTPSASLSAGGSLSPGLFPVSRLLSPCLLFKPPTCHQPPSEAPHRHRNSAQASQPSKWGSRGSLTQPHPLPQPHFS